MTFILHCGNSHFYFITKLSVKLLANIKQHW